MENTPTEQPAEQLKPFQLIPAFSIPKKAKGMAKAAGIDLEGVENMAPLINNWASSVEERLNANTGLLKQIIEAIPNLPEQTIKVLKAEAEKQRAEMMQQRQIQPQPQGQPQSGGGVDMLSMVSQFLPMLTGAGSNPMQDKINSLAASLLERALDKVTQPDLFTKFFEEEVARAKAKAMAAAVIST